MEFYCTYDDTVIRESEEIKREGKCVQQKLLLLLSMIIIGQSTPKKTQMSSSKMLHAKVIYETEVGIFFLNKMRANLFFFLVRGMIYFP